MRASVAPGAKYAAELQVVTVMLPWTPPPSKTPIGSNRLASAPVRPITLGHLASPRRPAISAVGCCCHSAILPNNSLFISGVVRT